MKKTILFIISIFFSCNSYAGTISLATISADATAGGFNSNFTIISNVINGNVQGSTDGGSTVSNIASDSVFEINMANDANPRVRDSELLTNTVDVFSSGSLTQNTFVYSGGTPATDSDLTSDVSAVVAYINGYRVSKAVTALTYQASMDTYVDLSQTGVYTQTAVAIGATQPAVAANSARLAKVTTSGSAITTVTDLANRRLPGLVVPSNYRSGLLVSKDSTTTVTMFPGTAEINNAMLPKTTTTTLTISTAGDWAGGTSLRAANTYGFVGEDASGNVKMHTTAPTHSNYAVSSTAGKLRYATWSSTVYRIFGWFYMDGAQNIENASNIKEGDVSNIIQSNDTGIVSFTGTTLLEKSRLNFYNSGGPIKIYSVVSLDAGTTDGLVTEIYRSGTLIPGAGSVSASSNAGTLTGTSNFYVDINRPQGTSFYSVYAKMITGTIDARRRELVIEEA